ncbi:hypothetical protein SBA5_470006 [Candidatus Sulfotelmatomonas gaucii]|uniref:Uncharacterized protein n=1 Tax=Candidatus Sulfuritelmatomonas gaucii TaxID=2043161 RepID=A0A2N9LP75_9BACT|nr:hypothetical protein SBA5_470006 [Candidatus Sulfotelmatomonas gaucii]
MSSSVRVSSSSMAPPPRARTSASPPASRAIVARSRSRKAASPSRRKSSGIVQPASAAITSSTSTKLQPSRRATSGPTVVLPEPMKPVSTMQRGNALVEEESWDGAVILSSISTRLHCESWRRAGRRPQAAVARAGQTGDSVGLRNGGA